MIVNKRVDRFGRIFEAREAPLKFKPSMGCVLGVSYQGSGSFDRRVLPGPGQRRRPNPVMAAGSPISAWRKEDCRHRHPGWGAMAFDRPDRGPVFNSWLAVQDTR
jgi:hypothetical protein